MRSLNHSLKIVYFKCLTNPALMNPLALNWLETNPFPWKPRSSWIWWNKASPPPILMLIHASVHTVSQTDALGVQTASWWCHKNSSICQATQPMSMTHKSNQTSCDISPSCRLPNCLPSPQGEQSYFSSWLCSPTLAYKAGERSCHILITRDPLDLWTPENVVGTKKVLFICSRF